MIEQGEYLQVEIHFISFFFSRPSSGDSKMQIIVCALFWGKKTI
jgi:hypothetical protein